MSQQIQTADGVQPLRVLETRPTPVDAVYREESATGAGWVLFAGIMMVLIGFLDVFQGLAVVLKSGFYQVPADYFVNVNATTWGWTYMIVGAIVVFAGFAVFRGAIWGRVIG